MLTRKILTLRIWLFILIGGIMALGPDSFHFAMSCAKLEFMFPDPIERKAMYTRYPTCSNLNTTASENTYVGVKATMRRANLEESAAAISMVFGLAGFIGYLINYACAEAYLNYTWEENERLKKFSMAKRRKLGWEKAEAKDE